MDHNIVDFPVDRLERYDTVTMPPEKKIDWSQFRVWVTIFVSCFTIMFFFMIGLVTTIQWLV